MTLAQNKMQIVQRIILTEDKKILKAIESILDNDDNRVELTTALKRELDLRKKAHLAGKSKSYTFEEIKNKITAKYKK